MDISPYKPRQRTAGISIFHDGLPKLASVHCYDRGNVATFGLQSCQPKPKWPTECYPIRPIPNHVNSKGPLMNHQRIYGEPKRLVNQSKVYSGAFYPPGSQPRFQFVDGRPIIIPSTFENKFISKEAFDASVNKSKSVIYNEPSQFYNCCNQYASNESPQKCPDDINKRSVVNGMPELTYNCPCTRNCNVILGRMGNEDYGITKSIPLTEGLHRGPFLPPSSKPRNPVGFQPRNHGIQSRPENGVQFKRRDPPLVIDLESEKEVDSCSANPICIPNSPTDSGSPIIPRSKGRWEENLAHKHDGDQQVPNPTSLRCNSCQQEVTISNSHAYIDGSSKSVSGYNFTSTLLCKECAKKSRMWDSMKNLPSESPTPPTRDNRDNGRCCCNSEKCTNRRTYGSRDHACNALNSTNSSPVVIDLEDCTNQIQARDCHSTNGVERTNSQLSNIAKRQTLAQDSSGDNLSNGSVTPAAVSPNCTSCVRDSPSNNTVYNEDARSPSCSCAVGRRGSRQNKVPSVSNRVTPETEWNRYNDLGAVVKHTCSPQGRNIHDKIKQTPVIIDLDDGSDEEDKTDVMTESCNSSSRANVTIEQQNFAMDSSRRNDSNTSETGGGSSTDSETHTAIFNGEVQVKSEVIEPDDSQIILHMEPTKDSNSGIIRNSCPEEKNEITLELDIDEESFESFINNNPCEELPPQNTTRSLHSATSMPYDNINQPVTNDLYDNRNQPVTNDLYDNSNQPVTNDLSRKRKLSCPDLPVSNAGQPNLTSSDTVPLYGQSKSHPTSPNYLINEEQLQKFRNKVVPVLKAKNWIRRSSDANEY